VRVRAQFKTLKYCPAFPDRFGSIQDARTFCAAFFTYYNHEHRLTGIGLHTPASVHYGTATEIREQRALVLDAPPTTPTRPASATVDPNHRNSPPSPGSTNHHAKHSSKTHNQRLSQNP